MGVSEPEHLHTGGGKGSLEESIDTEFCFTFSSELSRKVHILNEYQEIVMSKDSYIKVR